jgi:hypothetical protein
MHFGFGKKKENESLVSNFNVPPAQTINKADTIMDISDIKNNKKPIFEHSDSTAVMSGK